MRPVLLNIVSNQELPCCGKLAQFNGRARK